MPVARLKHVVVRITDAIPSPVEESLSFLKGR